MCLFRARFAPVGGHGAQLGHYVEHLVQAASVRFLSATNTDVFKLSIKI